jgi:hypothetical protein
MCTREPILWTFDSQTPIKQLNCSSDAVCVQSWCSFFTNCIGTVIWHLFCSPPARSVNKDGGKKFFFFNYKAKD